MHGFLLRRLLVRSLVAALAVVGFSSPATAQTVGLSTDVGNVPVAGSSSYMQSSGGYQLSGSGAGLGGSADAFHFAYYQNVLGDGQIVVRLASADPSAQTALVLRDSLDPNAAEAAIVVQNGNAQFVRRTTTGNNALADGTTSATVPGWLKLVRSGTMASVFLSLDGQSWTSLGTDMVTTPGTSFYVGLAVSNGTAGSTNAVNASFDNVTSTFLPSGGLLLWLKADAGVTQDASGLVSGWADQSGNGNDAAQPTVGSQPQAVAASLNGLPTLHFDGSSSFLSLPSGFSDFTAGVTALVITRPTDTGFFAHLFDLGNGPDSSNLLLGRNGSSDTLEFFSNNPTVHVTAPGAITLGSIQLFEYVQDTQVGSLYKDGALLASGGGAALANVTRTSNLIGKSNWSNNAFFQGDIAEVVLFNRGLTDSERQAWEAYLNAKYQYHAPPSAPAQLSVATLSSDRLALSWTESSPSVTGYTVERQNPDGTWSVVATLNDQATHYVDSSLTPGTTYTYRVSASNGVGTSVPSLSAAASTGSSSAASLPDNGLLLWLKADAGVTQDTGGAVTAWADQSGCGNDATQSNLGNAPQAIPSAINGEPAVRFDGVNSYLQMPSGFSDFTQGLSAFVVVRLSAAHAWERLFEFGNGPFSDNLILYRVSNSNDLEYDVYNGGGLAAAVTGPNSLTLGDCQLLEVVHGTDGVAALYKDGTLLSQGGASPIRDVTRTGDFLGWSNWGSASFQGDLAEVVVFNRSLTDSERQAWEAYLNAKYQFHAPPSAPSQLTVTALSADRLALSWMESSPNVTGYTVERENPDGMWSLVATLNGPATRYVDGGLVPGTSYTYRVSASNGVGTSVASILAVASTGSSSAASLPDNGLLLWLKGDAGVTQDASGEVSAWADQSGNGNDATQSAAGSSPQCVAGALNGEPVLRFDGASSYLQLPSGFSDFNQGMTALVVAKPTGASAWQRFFELANGPSVDSIVFCRYNSSNQFLFECVNGSTSLVTEEGSGGNDILLGTPQLFEVTQNSATGQATLYKNAQALTTQGAGQIANVVRTRNLIGWDNFGAARFQGDIAEIVLFDHALADPERQAWEHYLNAKYQFNPLPPAPGQPSIFTLSSTQLALSWTEAAPGITGYTVERENTDGTWSVVATLDGSTTSYVDAGLAPGTAYSYRVTASSAFGSSPASVATTRPTVAADAPESPSLIPGLQFWLRADDGVTSDANGAVSAWANQLGNGGASQINAANQPTLIGNDLNGLPALRFDGASSYLTSSFVGMDRPEVTFFVVTRGTQYQSLLRFQPYGRNDYLVYPWSSNPVFIDSNDGGSGNGVASGLVSGQWNIGAATYKAGGEMATYRDGSLVASRAAANVALPGGMPLGIGRYEGGSEYLQADVAEILIYDRALSDAERETVETYLNAKYAVIAPPAAPTGLSVSAISSTQANLLWTAASNALGYSVERKDATGGGDFGQVAAIAGGEVQAFIDGGLTAGTTYVYRLRAENEAGDSGYSAEASVTLPSLGANPLPSDDLLLWLRSNAGVVQSAGGQVTAWSDASGHGNNAFAPVGHEPSYLAAALNGQSALHFDGSSSYLQMPSGFSDFTDGLTALVVARPTSSAAWTRYFELGNGPAADNLLLAREGATDDLVYDGFDGGNLVTTLSAAGALALNKCQLLEVVQAPSGTVALYKNEARIAQGGAATINKITRANNFIAQSSWSAYGNFLYQGDIAEVLLFNHALSDAERQTWENYLNAKYQFNPPPPAPSGLAVVPLSATQVLVTWSEGFADVTGYTVERQNADGTWLVVANLPAGATSDIDGGLQPGTSYVYRVTASNGTGSSPTSATATSTTNATGSPFPNAGIRLWLHADAGINADAAGGVATWLDQSGGTAHNDAQLAYGNPPALVANALNNLPVVRFDGNSFYALPAGVLQGVTGAEAFVVLRATDPAEGARGLWQFGSNYSPAALYPFGTTTLQENFGTTSGYGLLTSPVPLDQFNLYDVSAAPGAWSARLNGQVLATSQVNTPDFSAGTPLLGRASNWPYPFKGDVAEVLIYDHPLSDDQRQSVQRYLASKYGLAAPPLAPVDLSAYAIAPGQVSVRWTCPPGSGTCSYNVERKQAGTDAYQVVATVQDTTSYLDPGTVAETTYTYRVCAVNLAGTVSGYSNEASVLTPATGVAVPTNGLRLWLQPGAASTGALNDWRDRSGRGNDALQASAGNPPQFVNDPSANNHGRAVVRFDGNSFYALPAGVLQGVTGAEAFVVLRATDPAEGARGLWQFGSNYSPAALYPFGTTTLQENFGTTSGYGPLTSPVPLDQFNLYDVSAAPGAWSARLNGQVLATSEVNTPDFSAVTPLLGRASTWSYPFKGDMAEVLIYDHPLSDDQRQSVQRYLAYQYYLAGFLAGQPDADNDGDGISNYQEYLDGTDANDYYNGQMPQIAIYAGNNQNGTAGAVVAQPLQVVVTNAAGEPLVNAPVVFAVTRANGLLADPDEPGTFASTLTVRSGAGGVTTVLFQAPAAGIFYTSLVTATAGTGSLVNHVTFAEAIAPDDDTSGDGLPDGWKLRYGFDLTIDNAAGDPDGDGLTNLQEYYLGTDPRVADSTSDGVPLAWLVAQGLDPRFDSLDALDPDAPGLTYRQEYRLQQSTIDLWSFDEGTGSHSVASSSGRRDVGVLVGNPAWTDDPDGGTALSFAAPGTSVDFGQPPDGHLDFPAPPASFSVAARFRSAASGNTGRLLGKGNQTQDGSPGYALDLVNGNLVFAVGSDGGTGTDLRVATASAYNDGQWHHVAAVFDRSVQQVSLYVDGIVQPVTVVAGSVGTSLGTSVDWSTAMSLDAGNPGRDLTVGGNGSNATEQLWGTTDNVGLFSKALTAAEVQALAGAQANQPPVVALSSPLPATEFPEMGAIPVQAQASSSGAAIAKVEFFSGSAKIGEVDAAPYQLAWQAPVGTYSLAARATDSRSASSQSVPVSITVSADSDHDGLPDDWELRYFGNLDQTASGSYLGDGMSNLTKYLLGLDPTKPVSKDAVSTAAVGLQVYTPLN